MPLKSWSHSFKSFAKLQLSTEEQRKLYEEGEPMLKDECSDHGPWCDQVWMVYGPPSDAECAFCGISAQHSQGHGDLQALLFCANQKPKPMRSLAKLIHQVTMEDSGSVSLTRLWWGKSSGRFSTLHVIFKEVSISVSPPVSPRGTTKRENLKLCCKLIRCWHLKGPGFRRCK